MNRSTRVATSAAVIDVASLCKRYGDRLEGAKMGLSAEINQISDTPEHSLVTCQFTIHKIRIS